MTGLLGHELVAIPFLPQPPFRSPVPRPITRGWERLVSDGVPTELARQKEITLATEPAIYFCDPHKPWQRDSNENTNGTAAG